MEVLEELEDVLFETLEKSKGTLQHLYVVFQDDYGGIYSQIDKYRLLESFPNLVNLMTIESDDHRSGKVRLRSVKTAQDSLTHQDSTSPLKVLWTARSETVWEMRQSARFENLVSFYHSAWTDSPRLRRFLEGPCNNLKHLGVVTYYMPEEAPCERLEFPRLEVLEIGYSEKDFPNWMVFPTSVKLVTWCGAFDLPSISELWIMKSREEQDIGSRSPQLKTV